MLSSVKHEKKTFFNVGASPEFRHLTTLDSYTCNFKE